MIVDRVFGMMSGIAFVLGLVCQIGWLTNLVEPSRLQWFSTIFFAFALIVLVYMVTHVGKRDGFAYTPQGELDLRPVIRALPTWARVVSYCLLAIAAVLLVLTVVSVVRADLLVGGLCAFESGSVQGAAGISTAASCHFPNLLMATMIATFGAVVFVDAVYLLRTPGRG